MLEIKVGGQELFDEETETFFTDPVIELQLEHSLVSLSKWESKWETPFLDTSKKSTEQVLDYVIQMIVSPEPAPEVLPEIADEALLRINEYINAKMTATWIHEENSPAGPQEIITAELIYYWMIMLGIPFECQYWHLNKLLMLIKVCNLKNAPKKKVGFAERAAMQRSLNDKRRAEYGSKG
jgi:hypothetical protein